VISPMPRKSNWSRSIFIAVGLFATGVVLLNILVYARLPQTLKQLTVGRNENARSRVANEVSSALVKVSKSRLNFAKASDFNTEIGAANYFQCEWKNSSMWRKSIYAHQLPDFGYRSSSFQFESSDFTPRCSAAGVTVFKGTALVGRCAAIITKISFMDLMISQ
jgi:hypothetical protein